MTINTNDDNSQLVGALSDALVECDGRMAKVREKQPKSQD
jgi:hypothetical protein